MFMNMWQWYSSAWEWSATLYVSLSTKLQSLLLSNVVCYQITVQVKAKLYSNFVKSGTLTGGKMEEAQETDSGFVEDKVNLNWRLPFFVEVRHCIFLECSNPFWLKHLDIRTSGPFPPTNADRWGAGKSRRERDRSQVSAFFQLILHLTVTSYIYNTEIF